MINTIQKQHGIPCNILVVMCKNQRNEININMKKYAVQLKYYHCNGHRLFRRGDGNRIARKG